MAEPITFSEIPATTRKPGVYMEFNTSAANRLLPTNDQRILIIAQASAGAPQAPLIPFDIYSADQVGATCGFGSLAYRMAKAGIKAYPYATVQMILLAEDDWAVASAAVTVDGVGEASAATSSGLLSLIIGGSTVRIDIATGDTPTDIKQALADAINADIALPVSASIDDDISLTCKTTGSTGDLLGLAVTCTAGGIAATCDTSLTGGGSHPNANDFQAALDAVFVAGHQIIATPYVDTDTLEALRDHLDLVSNGVEQRSAIGICAAGGTIADAKARMSALNPKRLAEVYLRGLSSWSPEIAAAAAFVKASESDPARPLNGLALKGIAAPAVSDWLSRTEQEDLLHHGVTPLEVGPGNLVQIVRMISGYTVNNYNVPDPSLLDITTICSLDYVRRACRERIILSFPRPKNSASRRRSIRSTLLAVLKQLESPQFEVVQDVDRWKDDLVVVPDGTDATRANARIPADIVRGLHVLAAEIDLL